MTPEPQTKPRRRRRYGPPYPVPRLVSARMIGRPKTCPWCFGAVVTARIAAGLERFRCHGCAWESRLVEVR